MSTSPVAAPPPGRRPRIALVATGGTISCVRDTDGYAVKAVPAAVLAGALDDVGVSAVPVSAGMGSSWTFTPGTMLDLARRVEALLDGTAPEGRCDGVVVTHGTDTLEETAAFLSFAVGSDAPVVLTGAMRTYDAAGADGPANIAAAGLVAADPAAAGRGALVVLGDEIHAGVDVTKAHSSSVAAFTSPAGPLGRVDDGRVTFARRGPERVRYDVRRADARVPLLVAAAGLDAELVTAAVATADGVVVAGFGMGHVPASWVDPLADAMARGLPVVVTTRTGAGPVGPVYRGDGGGVDLAARGVIAAGFRSPYRARIELVCALGAGLGVDAIRAAFASGA